MTLAVKCPILGFEETKNMEFSTIDEVFVRLKSLDGKEFSFVLINPYLIRPDYEFDIPAYYQELLSLITTGAKKFTVDSSMLFATATMLKTFILDSGVKERSS